MKRRTALAGLLTASLGPTLAARAQEADRLPKVAFLSPMAPSDVATLRDDTLRSLLRTLSDLGYVDGENIVLKYRFADHALERLPMLAAELVAGQPDVLWTFTSGGARAAAAATSAIRPTAAMWAISGWARSRCHCGS